MAVTARQRQFVVEYLIDFNGTQAAIRAGYTQNAASEAAYSLLSNSQVAAAIEDKIAERLEVAELSVDWVLRQWKQIAEADPAELIRAELQCCRHCYGVNHRYQWTRFEHEEACERAAAHRCGKNCEPFCGKAVPPAAPGGFEFDPHRAPVAECPVCHGEGETQVRIADTLHLKGSARRLYAGIKQTKDGIEIKMRDQDAALQSISKYLGMVVARTTVSNPDGSPLIPAGVTAKDFTDDQLAALLAQRLAEEK